MPEKYDPKIHHRRSIRLDGYDYSQDGWYSVTMCALGHKCLFGKFDDGQIQLYEYGRIIDKCWKWLAEQITCMGLLLFVRAVREPPLQQEIPRNANRYRV